MVPMKALPLHTPDPSNAAPTANHIATATDASMVFFNRMFLRRGADSGRVLGGSRMATQNVHTGGMLYGAIWYMT